MSFDYSRPARLRFAPSPTGSLHVGGARTALFNYLIARRTSGKFVLRIEDTDAARNRADAERAVIDGLHWLGIDWDEGPDAGGPYAPYRQSERLDIYRERASRLREAGLVYEDDGALRFRIPSGTTVVDDLVKGRIAFENVTLPDPVILEVDRRTDVHLCRRRRRRALYGDQSGAAGRRALCRTRRCSILLMQAMDLRVPQYAHVPLILNEEHQKLSKRHDTAWGSRIFAQQGILPEAMIDHLALLGWSPSDGGEEFTLPELARTFSLERIHKGGAVFNEPRLRAFNARALRKLPRADLIASLAAAMQSWGFLENPPPEAALRWLDTFLDAYGEELATLEQARPLVAALRAEGVTDSGARARTAPEPPGSVLSRFGRTVRGLAAGAARSASLPRHPGDRRRVRDLEERRVPFSAHGADGSRPGRAAGLALPAPRTRPDQ